MIHRPALLLSASILALARPVLAADASPNLPMPAPALAERLAREDFVIRAAEGAGGGVMGALRLDLEFAEEPAAIRAKWKATGPSGDGWNNSPRREIGVYAMQEYFLEPGREVVPPVAARCIPLDTYAVVDADAAPTLEGTRCVLGALSAWLERVEQPRDAFDRERFVRDPAYANRFADLNLLLYLVDHRDARGNNFLMSTVPGDPRVYSVDNGIAFGGVLYNFFTAHLNEIRVPLSRAAIDRLRRVSRRDLDRLGVLGEMVEDDTGTLRHVVPGPNLDPEAGVRRTPAGIQFGLTRAEIDAVVERLRALLARIDAGDVQLF